MTLATSKFVTVESVNAEKEASQTVTCTTTTRTTMTRVVNEAPVECDEVPCAQKPKILLYESTKEDNGSDILTDDDTDSVGSSIDSKELELGIKEMSQLTTQGNAANIDRIDTQMQNLSFASPLNKGNSTTKSDEHFQNMSRQFDQLELQQESLKEITAENIEEANNRSLSCSIQTLSSNDTMDHEAVEGAEEIQGKDDSNEVIVLSDSDTDEPPPAEKEPRTRIMSQEPPLKPSFASSNDNAMYNISPLSSSAMQKVNNFFDNAPFVEPIENSFSTSRMSNSVHEDVYVPETTDEESVNESAVNESSIAESIKNDEVAKQTEQSEAIVLHEEIEQIQPDFSDNNIIVDIPVIKSTSDQPRQVIRSTSGVRLTASHSSPIIKTSAGIIRTPGSSIRVNSNNGQVSIAAKININIQIVEDSSEESSEDNMNKPARKSQAIQSSEDCPQNHSDRSSTPDGETAQKRGDQKPQEEPKPRTPARNNKLDAIKTPTKTPSTANKLKQFEFVPPRSMSKNKIIDSPTEKKTTSDSADTKPANKSISSESSECNDGFVVDKNIPVSPRDQRLLVSSICLRWFYIHEIQS